MTREARSIRTLDSLKTYVLSARDGEIGKLEDVYFGSNHWIVRYFVAGTGGWLGQRHVLVAPRAVRRVNEAERILEIDLERDQVKGSPPTDLEVMMSRKYEELYHRHYGWEPYWTGASRASGDGSSTRESPPAFVEEEASAELPNPSLRSGDEIRGCQIQARDGFIGHVEDLLIDDGEWRVRYLEVNTRNWWPGRRVLIAPAWIQGMSWARREVRVEVTRQAVRSAPEYDPAEPLGPDDEIRLFEHYGLSGREGD